ncbi:hypothetical protein H5410_008062 [Solanum commersonii]|uniref:Uncharacterized protein n=1 Tax=Solanum commersonii TaxID=4109 RepID=A0A9J6AEZ1_SOLCO|nr:hypothetical protein H5410_008062 [Solanum commersonii]
MKKALASSNSEACILYKCRSCRRDMSITKFQKRRTESYHANLGNILFSTGHIYYDFDLNSTNKTLLVEHDGMAQNI